MNGRHIEGEILAPAVDVRIKTSGACIAFTTRRGDPAPDGSYGTHPWVIQEMAGARALGIRTIEVREDGVKVGGPADQHVQLRFSKDQREKMLVDLVSRLAQMSVKPIRVKLKPPEQGENEFIRHAVKGNVTCSYLTRDGGVETKLGEAIIQPVGAGFFVDIEKPANDALIAFQIPRPNGGAWMSPGEGLVAIEVRLIETET